MSDQLTKQKNSVKMEMSSRHEDCSAGHEVSCSACFLLPNFSSDMTARFVFADLDLKEIEILRKCHASHWEGGGERMVLKLAPHHAGKWR